MKTLKPWQKVALIIIAVLATFTAVAIIAILSVLPDPAALGERLRANRPTENRLRARTSTNLAIKRPATLSGTQASSAPSFAGSIGASPTPAPTPLTAADKKRLVSQRFIERYMSDDRMRSEICENLATTGASTPFRNAQEFGQQIEMSLLNEAATEVGGASTASSKLPPATEAVMLPIQYTLKNDAVRDLIRDAENAAERGNTSFIGKARFYAQAARATASVLSSRDELEAISGHAYRLYALSRAAALKPGILQDPEAASLCRDIERSAIDGVSFDETDDRARLLELLSRHGIDPESIDYNPSLSRGLDVQADGDSFNVKIPWLDRVLNPRAF